MVMVVPENGGGSRERLSFPEVVSLWSCEARPPDEEMRFLGLYSCRKWLVSYPAALGHYPESVAAGKKTTPGAKKRKTTRMTEQGLRTSNKAQPGGRATGLLVQPELPLVHKFLSRTTRYWPRNHDED